METVYLCLGTNLGDRKANIDTALIQLKAYDIRILKTSSIYETEPVGYKGQPDFYNICLKAETQLSPHELLKAVKSIETQMGRKKTVKNGPRIIDIDILFYRNIILNDKELTIPHSGIETRRFVLEPLCEIAEELIHPVPAKTIKELLNKGDFSGKVKKIGEKNV